MKKIWNNLSISAKMLASVAAILSIFTIALSIDFVFLSEQEHGINNLNNNLSPALAAARGEQQHFLEMAERSARFHLNHTPAALKHYQEFYGQALQSADLSLDKLKSLPLTKDEGDVVTQVAGQVKTFDAAAEKSFQEKFSGNADLSLKMFLGLHTSDLADLITKLNNSVSQRYTSTATTAVEASRKAEFMTVIAGLVAIVVSFLIGTLVGRSISIRLRQVTAAIGEVVNVEIGALVASMKLLAAGDLTAKIETRSSPLLIQGNDEPAILAKAYNELLAGIKNVGSEFTSTTELLGSMVMQIKASVEQVSTAAGEIAEGSTNLSQRTEEQASGLEETASSMEEFTATVKQNSQNAQEANSLGASAQDQAKKSGEVMHDVVATMDKINGSSQKIVEIISVIDGIAFQTNILALNAAVEAARAGEQGRGFAVVAGEVRSLAQRSAAAAKEIKELIGDTVSKVSDGAALVEQAGSTMDELVGSVERVTAILGDIAAASREQSSGIDQVNKAITQMDEVTQQNAALVEEAAAAATSLEEQARALLETVGAFKVDAAPSSPRSTASTTRTASHAPAHKPNIARKHVGKATVAASHSNGKATVGVTASAESDWETF